MIDYTASNITKSWDGTVLIVDEENYTARESSRMRMTEKPDFSLNFGILAGITVALAVTITGTISACLSADNARTDLGHVGLLIVAFGCFSVFMLAIVAAVYCVKETTDEIKTWRTRIPSNAKYIHMDSVLIETLQLEYRGSWYDIVQSMLDRTSIGGAYYFAIETYVRSAFHLQEPFTEGTTNASRRPTAKEVMHKHAKQCTEILSASWDIQYQLRCSEVREASIPATALLENALQRAQEPVDT